MELEGEPIKRKFKKQRVPTDPFEYINEFHLRNLVLQHLRFDEVLSASTVSPKWKEIIANSDSAMSRMKMNFYDSSSTYPTRTEVTKLLKSSRRYKALEFDFRLMSNIERKLLLLKRFSLSLVDLTLTYRCRVPINKLPLNISFPQLRTLQLDICLKSNNLITECFTQVEDLETITFNGAGGHTQSTIDLIKRQNKLKKLNIECWNREILFAHNVFKDAKFKLESLSWNSCEKKPLSITPQINFNEFLLQHSNTLTFIFIDTITKIDLMVIVNDLKALKTLHFHIILGSRTDLIFKSNHCIQELKTNEFYGVELLPKGLLKSLKAIEHLILNHLDEDILNWIAGNLMSLKKLTYDTASEIQDINAYYSLLTSRLGHLGWNVNIELEQT
ncbi:CLUMA_CG001933, isoform A [Clunio marinus]|uniref:CLUMA_CG001933, isoform A n=1 Tax=Clunio marinus TaxID=568069 RepID=A0A1J1HL62_9DIPT|nr:CLUMA_CG001933, isoform A [Clunio marinus]